MLRRIKSAIKFRLDNIRWRLTYKFGRSVESLETTAVREAFYRSFVGKGDLVFDVGANIGNRVQPLLNIGARIVAVEPQKKCHELLKFRFGRSIEIVTQGLGEREEVRDFYEASEHIISSFSTEWIEAVRKTRFQKYSWSEPVKIQMTTLDKLVSIHGIPKFIKIDVEGFELEVLKGLTHAVRLISFEYTVPEQTSKAIACIEQIETHSPGAVCNYSIGESMEFAMKEWMPASDFRAFLLTDVFSETSFGDIYVRSS